MAPLLIRFSGMIVSVIANVLDGDAVRIDTTVLIVPLIIFLVGMGSMGAKQKRQI
jgi:hypothetical protein